MHNVFYDVSVLLLRIRFDTIGKKSLTWTQELSDQLNHQLNLAHVARKNMKKKKLKQSHASAHLV